MTISTKADAFWYALPILLIFQTIICLVRKTKISISAIDLMVSFLLLDTLLVGLLNNKVYIENTSLIINTIFFAIYLFFRNRQDYNYYFAFILLLSANAIFQIGLSYYQLQITHSGLDIKGTLFNSAYDAQFIVLGMSGLLYLINIRFVAFKKYLLITSIALLVLGIVIETKSRTSIISLIIIVVFQFWGHLRLNSKVIVIASSILIITFLMQIKQGSSTGRLLILKATIINAKDFFPMGLGLSGFQTYYPIWQSRYFIADPHTMEIANSDDIPIAFNGWVQDLAENGLLWVIVFGYLVFSVLKAKTANSEIANTLKCVLVIILVQAATSNVLQINVYIVILFSCLAILNNLSIPYSKIETCRIPPSGIEVCGKVFLSFALSYLLIKFIFTTINHINWRNSPPMICPDMGHCITT